MGELGELGLEFGEQGEGEEEGQPLEGISTLWEHLRGERTIWLRGRRMFGQIILSLTLRFASLAEAS